LFLATGESVSAYRIAQPSPAVSTGAATSIAQSSATLHASVDPNGFAVSECKFEYGPTTSYGSSAPCTPAPGSGESPVAVSAALESLAENSTYHFRIVATSLLGGTSVGADRSFTTTLVLGPYWYENGVKVGEETEPNPQPVLWWGTLTLTSQSTGTLAC